MKCRLVGKMQEVAGMKENVSTSHLHILEKWNFFEGQGKVTNTFYNLSEIGVFRWMLKYIRLDLIYHQRGNSHVAAFPAMHSCITSGTISDAFSITQWVGGANATDSLFNLPICLCVWCGYFCVVMTFLRCDNLAGPRYFKGQFQH